MPARVSKKVQERSERLRSFILPILKREYPDAKCRLDFTKPLELLVATILSAQCTDDRVNIVTKELFKKYKNAKAYADVPPETLEKDIQSTGFYRNKAKSIRGMAAALVGGASTARCRRRWTSSPRSPASGARRPTSCSATRSGSNVGVVVDTHVTRVSNRLGLTDHAVDAVKIEQDLIQVVPQEDWTLFSHLLIRLGRAYCKAPKPKCEGCPLLPHCPSGPKFLAAEAKRLAKKKKKQ